MWPNCCLRKLTQSTVIHSRHSNCKMSGFAAVYLRSVILWHVVKSMGSLLPTFWDSMLVPFSGLKVPKKNAGRCL
jgi:hypothetical protein